MASPLPENELNDTIERAIRELQSASPVQKQLVEKVIVSLRAAQATNRTVFSEVSSLSDYIAHARREISALKTDSIGGEYIPTATDELDAVVSATEDATHKIMDCCDAIGALADTAPDELQNSLNAQVTKIFEACNFQDITGQRITKVVRTLKHIEAQVASLLAALETAGLKSGDKQMADAPLNVSQATDTEKHLLNGPQAADQAIKQDDIDKLFG